MWILSILPDFFIHTLLLLSIAGTLAGFLLTFIPFVSQYKLPIQVVSIIVLVFSVYLQGGIAQKEKYELEIAKMKQKVAEAEAESAIANVEIVEHVRTETQVVYEKGEDIVRVIREEVIKYDSKCDIPEIVITTHNAAAKNQPVTVK